LDWYGIDINGGLVYAAPRTPPSRFAEPSVSRSRTAPSLCQEDTKWQSVVLRTCRYLHNIVEQDDGAIKRRCASMLGFKSFKTATITLAGIELV